MGKPKKNPESASKPSESVSNEPRVEEIDLDALIEDPTNANLGTERGHAALENSIRDLGAGRSIVVDRHGVVIAGNKTREAAINAGLQGAIVVESDGKRLVVVKRTDLDLRAGGAARRLAYADNRIAELDLAWDPNVLRASFAAGDGALDGLFTDKELINLIARADEEPADGSDDDVPEPPATPVTKLGDLWRIGDLALLCGDSTKKEDVARACGGEGADLVATDPPYNVGVGDSNNPRKRNDRPLSNDKMSSDDFAVFMDGFAAATFESAKPGAAIYVAMSSQEMSVLDLALKRAGMRWSTTIIWAKDRFTLTRRDFHSQYEPIWYGWRGDAPRIRPVPARDVGDVWEIPRPARSEQHPTMKPVELLLRMLRFSSRPGDLVLDPFGGSGTTAIAAARLERRVALVELDPRYCDVIVERVQKEIGLKATR